MDANRRLLTGKLDAVPSSEISTLPPAVGRSVSQSARPRNILCALSHTILPRVTKCRSRDFKPAPRTLPIICPFERHKMVAAPQIYRKGCNAFLCGAQYVQESAIHKQNWRQLSVVAPLSMCSILSTYRLSSSPSPQPSPGRSSSNRSKNSANATHPW